MGGAYANLWCNYEALADISKAIEYHTMCLAISKEVGDRAEEGKAYGNLGNAYRSLGNAYRSLGNASKAIEYHTQDLAVAKEVGDRKGLGRAYANLGDCHTLVNEYDKLMVYHAEHAIATELGIPHMQLQAAAGMGVALALQVRSV